MLVFLDGIKVDVYSMDNVAGKIADYMHQYLLPPPNFYETLGVARDAKTAEIRKAFKTLSRALHPDTGANGGDPDRFTLVTVWALPGCFRALSAFHIMSMLYMYVRAGRSPAKTAVCGPGRRRTRR